MRNDKKLLDARRDELFGLAQNIRGRARDEIAAQFWDDAEGAAIVAAFGNFQIGVVARRELDALRRQEIEERIVRRRGGFMDRLHDGVQILRAGDPMKVRKFFQDRFRLRAHAAGDDDLAVFRRRRANRGQRFSLGAVEKTAGVDDDRRRVLMRLGEFVAFGPQAPDDPLAVDERLGAAKRDEGNFWRAWGRQAMLGGRWSSACWLGIHAPAWHARRRLASSRRLEDLSKPKAPNH